MNTLSELASAVDALIDDVEQNADGGARLVHESRARVDQLVAALVADAARYRWLRDHVDPHDGKPFIAIFNGSFSAWNSEHADAATDAAIDSARAAESTKEGECKPYDLPPGDHDWTHGQCGRCGATQSAAVRGEDSDE
ncbi:MAG: hypothetical protein RL684_1960 [Pseudomonadota bacterium]